MTTTTRVAGAFDRLEVTPELDVELDDVVFGLVRLKVSSDTVKHTADGEARTVALTATDLAVILNGPLERTIKLALTARAAERDRAAGRPPLEHDGESVDGQVADELKAALEEANAELDDLEDELTGGPVDGPDEDLEVDGDPAGADEPAPDGQADPFDPPAGDVDLDEDGVTPELDDGSVWLAVSGRSITVAELAAARARVVGAFGTDYVTETSAALREDLLGIEHVAAWLLRDLRIIEEAAGARPEVMEYLDGRLASTEYRYADEDPFKGYKSATVDSVLNYVDQHRPLEEERGNWPELAERILVFEKAHKNRKTVIDGLETLLETIPEAELPAPDPGFEPNEDPDAEERGE